MTFPRLYGRLLVAIPGIALFLFVIFRTAPYWGLFLFSSLSLLAAWEAVQLCCTKGISPFARVITSFLAGAATLFTAIDHPLSLPVLILPGAAIALCVMVTLGPAHSRRRIAGTASLVSLYAIGFGLMGRIYLLWGPWALLALLALCWVGDSAAYFTGIAFGRHKLMPRVSPAKSWEGFFGGLIGAVAGSALAGSPGGLPLTPLLVAGFAGGVAGVLGDLFESSIKRDAGVKDSSGLLLGHGGILDRFDSAVAAAPVFMAVLFLFGVS